MSIRYTYLDTLFALLAVLMPVLPAGAADEVPETRRGVPIVGARGAATDTVEHKLNLYEKIKYYFDHTLSLIHI